MQVRYYTIRAVWQPRVESGVSTYRGSLVPIVARCNNPPRENGYGTKAQCQCAMGPVHSLSVDCAPREYHYQKEVRPTFTDAMRVR